MSSKPVVITLGLNDAPLKRGLDGVRGQMRQLQASAQQMGHSTVSTMQASSAAIRVMEGGITGNIRAAERFIGILPGVGTALQAAFPLIGGIALAGVFIKIGVEAAKFIQKMNEIPPNPFEGMIASGKIANDQLAISNDRLAMEIAKLEHKPANGMALALDQARESSDKLFESLMKANAAFAEANGKNDIGVFKGMWTGMAWTDTANKTITKARSGVQAVTADHQPAIDDALASGNQENVKQAREALMVDLQKAYAQQDAQLRAGLAYAQKRQAQHNDPFSSGADFSKVIEKYQGALAQSANEQKDVGGNYGQSVMQPQKDALDAAKANAEAAKQAAAELVQQWHKDLDAEKSAVDVTLAMEAQFWDQRAMLTKKGGLATAAAFDEANKVIARMRAESARAGDEFDALSGGSALDHPKDTEAQAKQRAQASAYLLGSGNQMDNSTQARQGRDDVERLRSLNQGIELQDANAIAIANASLQMEIMTGRISALDAARVQQIMHEQEYQKALDGVNRAMAAAESLTPGAYRDKTISDLNNQRGQIETTHTIQSAQDQQNISGNTIEGAAKDSLNKMVQSFNDLAANLKNVIPKMVDGLNDDLAKLATGHGNKADFGKTLSGTGQSLIKASLQKVEGGLLGAAGLGKPDGSQANPIYTKDANGVASVGGKLAGNALFRPFIGGQQDQQGQGGQDQSGGSIWRRLAGAFLPALFGQKGGNGGSSSSGASGTSDDGDDSAFQGFFADGGNVVANRPAMVGERGRPEMFVPHTAGRIIPSSQLGGGGDTHIHVDARGATNPSEVHAAVMRAAPHIIAASSHTEHQRSIRTPRGK